LAAAYDLYGNISQYFNSANEAKMAGFLNIMLAGFSLDINSLYAFN